MFSRMNYVFKKYLGYIISKFSFSESRLGILFGFTLVISLFSLLQIFSIGYLSHILNSTKTNVEITHRNHQQEALMDRARIELLIASDKLNRAGIYYMEDKETGSEGSWQSLLNEALQSLQQSQDSYLQLQAVSAQDSRQELSELKESYHQLYQGLVELAQGLAQKHNIDTFFEVPIQGFQSDFTEKYYRYLQENEKGSSVMDEQLLSSLSSAKQIIIGALAILLVLAFSAWLGVTRWMIAPLNHLISRINKIAAGDLSYRIEDTSFACREIRQLTYSVRHMQEGLVALVSQVRGGAEVILTGMNQITTDNHRLSEQTHSQTQSLAVTAQSMQQLTVRVKQNSMSAEQANHLVNEARDTASEGGEMMSNVVSSMADISTGSREISEIITLIESVAFQTNILALNAAIEAAHAGEHGRGFFVVAREVGTLAHQSGHSAQNIKRLIQRSANSVSAGVSLVNRSGENLQAIIDVVKKVTDLMAEITTASHYQSKGIEAMAAQVEMINDATKQNAALVEQSAHASEVLQQQTLQLNRSVARFCLPVEKRSPLRLAKESAVAAIDSLR
ncbi:methyl-accepting chemotaxis protein [Yersinia similis]|uniref:methyl-accepting chemotaxis protein n=1 Tax=Yersinia similis TaxID=367190 RepID=UPI00067C61A6|nr:methyl-accepting chemotaxis protein [Yersinia similis]